MPLNIVFFFIFFLPFFYIFQQIFISILRLRLSVKDMNFKFEKTNVLFLLYFLNISREI